MNIKELSLTELKALKNDQRDELERIQTNIAFINAEMQIRAEEQAKKEIESMEKVEEPTVTTTQTDPVDFSNATSTQPTK